MSERTRALQRWMVRLLLEPDLVEALHAGHELPGLSAADAALLRAVDPRAWSTDAWRRPRLVQAIAEELPVTVALVGLAAVDAFFSSEAFVRVLTRRGSMALAFADHVSRSAGPLAAVERELARVRRRQPAPGAGVVRSPRCGVVTAGSGTLAAWQEARARLGPEPLLALTEGITLPPVRFGREPEHVLITLDPQGEAELGLAPPALAALLLACASPRPRPQVEREARRLGAGRDAAGLVEQLIREGLLVGQ